MKVLVGFSFLAILLLNCQPSSPDPWVKSEAFQQWCRSAFQSDSGFVNTRQQRILEELICQIDTSILPFEHCSLYAIGDTTIHSLSNSTEEISGKYFRSTDKGLTKWVLCLNVYLDGWENPYIFEIQQRADKFTIASWAHYRHSSYACCWDGPMGGFYRLGPYFFVETCGRGSGFCAGEANILFFPLQRASIQADPPGIPVSWFQSGVAWPEYLNSRFTVKNDTIVVNYEYELDSTIVLDRERDTFIPLEHYYFQALFKAEPVAHRLQLINRNTISQYKRAGILFDEFK